MTLGQLLLEHGFKANDLAEFAKRGHAGTQAAAHKSGGLQATPEDDEDPSFKRGLKENLNDGMLADASSGVIM